MPGWVTDAALRGPIRPVQGIREKRRIMGIDSGRVGVGWEGELKVLGIAALA